MPQLNKNKNILERSSGFQKYIYAMDNSQEVAIYDTIHKALAVRGNCSRFIMVFIRVGICYAAKEDTSIYIPENCYHVLCEDCALELTNK